MGIVCHRVTLHPTNNPDYKQHIALLWVSQVLEQELVIKPGDSEIARLSILPLKPGLLRIVGLEWVLNGQAQGKKMFEARRPAHRRSGSKCVFATACTEISTLHLCNSAAVQMLEGNCAALCSVEIGGDVLPLCSVSGVDRSCEGWVLPGVRTEVVDPGSFLM